VTRERSALGPLRELDRGGSGVVHEAVGTGTVFKEFTAAGQTDVLRWAEGSVAFWRSLPPAEQAELAAMAAWPTDLVVDHGVVVGVLMPLIAGDFWHTRTGLDGRVQRQPSNLKWLMAEDSLLGDRFDRALFFDDSVRFELLAQTLRLLAWLHRRGVVFGDVSGNNFMFTLSPPRVLGIDCDAVVTGPSTDSAVGRMTNFYVPPEFQGPGARTTVDAASDTWKAAILLLRALTPGPRCSQRRPDAVRLLRGRVPDRLLDVLTACLTDDPDQRPPLTDLFACVEDVYRTLSSPPTAALLEVVDPVVRHGGTVELRWAFDGADAIVVEAPDGARHDLDPATHPHGFTFPATTSGLLAVHATNRHGTSTFPLGPVLVYDVPAAAVTFPHPFPGAPRLLDPTLARRLPTPPAVASYDVRRNAAPDLTFGPIPSGATPSLRADQLLDALAHDAAALEDRLARLRC
jgi:hypothetical protein